MSSHTHLWYVKSGHFGTMDREYSCTGLVKCRCSSRPCYLLVFIVEWHWLFFSYGMRASSLHLFLGLATNMVLNSGATSSWQLWSDTFTGQKERSIAIKMEAGNVIFLVCLLKRITSTDLTVYTFDLYTHQVHHHHHEEAEQSCHRCQCGTSRWKDARQKVQQHLIMVMQQMVSMYSYKVVFAVSF